MELDTPSDECEAVAAALALAALPCGAWPPGVTRARGADIDARVAAQLARLCPTLAAARVEQGALPALRLVWGSLRELEVFGLDGDDDAADPDADADDDDAPAAAAAAAAAVAADADADAQAHACTALTGLRRLAFPGDAAAGAAGAGRPRLPALGRAVVRLPRAAAHAPCCVAGFSGTVVAASQRLEAACPRLAFEFYEDDGSAGCRQSRTPGAVSGAAGAAPAAPREGGSAGPPLPAAVSALIVGGGPAGLAAALQLSARGWRDVVVLERRDSVQSYVYNIDGRGRRLLDRHGLGAALEEAGVSTEVVSLLRVQADGAKEEKQQVIKDAKRGTHWLPRAAFVGLLAGALARSEHAANVRVVTNARVSALRRTPGGVEADVSVSPPGGGAEQVVTIRPRLLVGADGAASAVREALEAWAADDGALRAAGSFRLVEAPCPSAGLRFKVLPMPPNPVLRDGTALPNPSFALLQGRKAAALGPGAAPIRLGLLPIKSASDPRTANLITTPGHPIWEVTEGEAMYGVLEDALPQADWRALVPPAVMSRFAASRGGVFPAPTHADGAGAGLGGGGAAVLLGDALHCFPPDLGQGVNSALLDVLALDAALDATATPAIDGGGGAEKGGDAAAAGPGGADLGAAAADYQRRQLPEARAICALMPLGFPLQYFNSWRRQVWTLVFLIQTAANKVAPWLVPPATFMMIQDSSLGYTEILARVRRAQAVGRAALAVVVASALHGATRLAAALAAGAA
ncbi:MAG: hypothetical protein J3K34DRAFT_520699 [Monoraphidium minutum]|nr:MAG: hypothetical protein J3K34DRAFT_520699 [Monoraphidium minutum]